jgi:hypothetical protein
MAEPLTNIWFILLLLLVLTLILIFINKVSPLNKVQLKKLDYIWLSLSALGIFGLVENNRIQMTEIELTRSQWFHEAACDAFSYIIDTNNICLKYEQLSSSPDNFIELQSIRDSLCNWSKHLAIFISKKVKEQDT